MGKGEPGNHGPVTTGGNRTQFHNHYLSTNVFGVLLTPGKSEGKSVTVAETSRM